MGQTECSRYFSVGVYVTVSMNEEISHRLRDEERLGGALRTVQRHNRMSVEARTGYA